MRQFVQKPRMSPDDHDERVPSSPVLQRTPPWPHLLAAVGAADLSFKQARDNCPTLASQRTDLPVADPAGRARLDARVRRGRPLEDLLRGRGRPQRFREAATAAHEAGRGGRRPGNFDMYKFHADLSQPRALVGAEGRPELACSTRFDGSDNMGDEGVLMPARRIGTVLANNEIHCRTTVIPGLDDQGEQPVLVYYDHVFRAAAPCSPCCASRRSTTASPTSWVADEELNFRRFFDVDTPARSASRRRRSSTRPTPRLLDLYKNGLIDAFRIDHPDGLADPRGYMRRLLPRHRRRVIAAEDPRRDEPMPDRPAPPPAPLLRRRLAHPPRRIGDPPRRMTATLALQITGDIPGSPSVIEQSSARSRRRVRRGLPHREPRQRDLQPRHHAARPHLPVDPHVAEVTVARAVSTSSLVMDADAASSLPRTTSAPARGLTPSCTTPRRSSSTSCSGARSASRGTAPSDRRDELVVRSSRSAGRSRRRASKTPRTTAGRRWSRSTRSAAPRRFGASPRPLPSWRPRPPSAGRSP